MIKPIETYYNGFHFRSRLEARWAVFFDAAGIEYQYEPEGFDLGNGLYYLPDFYLPRFDLYVEIKPFDKSIVNHVGDHNKWEKVCERFRDITDRAILVCYDDPAKDLFKYLFAFDTCDSSAGCSEYYANFIKCGNDVVLCTQEERTDRVIYTRWNHNLTENKNVGTPSMFRLKADDDGILWFPGDKDLSIIQDYDPNKKDILNFAKTKARQARFEHGETPKIKEGSE